MFVQRFNLSLIFTVVLAIFTGCDQSSPPPEVHGHASEHGKHPHHAHPITSKRNIAKTNGKLIITDDMGRTVILTATPKRIAAAVPAAVEVLCLLEKPPVIRMNMAEDRVYPASAKDIPTMEVGHATGPNLEQLVTAKPDLIILSPTFAAFLPGLKQLGIPALVYSIRDMHDVPNYYKHIGQLVDAKTKATELATQMQQFIDQHKIEANESSPKVFALFGISDAFHAFMPESYLGSMVRTLGGNLVTQGAIPVRTGSSIGSFSMEKIVASNPDVIIVISHGQDSKISDKLAGSPLWANLNAVKNKRVYMLSEWLFLMNPGPRMTDALPQLKQAMYAK